MNPREPLIINGWQIYAHTLFIDQFESLAVQVKKLSHKYPDEYKGKRKTKLLAAISKLAFEIIPQDPTLPKYRQGNTLGSEYKHWFRAKFFQQYRLFFRYHLKQQVIVYVWVNDEKSKRAYGSSSDAYTVFRKMLDSGNPPNDWDELLRRVTSNSKQL